MSEIKQSAESAAIDYSKKNTFKSVELHAKLAFEAGAEWQKEQEKDKIYTLKDMEAAFEAGKTYGDTDACFRFTDSVSRKEWEETPDFSQFIKEYQHDT